MPARNDGSRFKTSSICSAGQNVSANQTRTSSSSCRGWTSQSIALSITIPPAIATSQIAKRDPGVPTSSQGAANGITQMSVPHRIFTIDEMRPRARTRTGAKSAGVASAVKMAAVRIAVMRIRPCFLVIVSSPARV